MTGTVSVSFAAQVFLENFESYGVGTSPTSGGAWTQAGVFGTSTVVQPGTSADGSKVLNLKPGLLGQFVQSAGIRRSMTDQFGFPTQVLTVYFRYTNPSAGLSRMALQCQGLVGSVTPDLELAMSLNRTVTFTSNGTVFTTTLPVGALTNGWNRLDLIQDRTSFPYRARFALNGNLNSLSVPATGDFYYQTQVTLWASGTTDAIQFDALRYTVANNDETYAQVRLQLEDYSGDTSQEAIRLSFANLNNAAFSFVNTVFTDREGYVSFVRQRDFFFSGSNAPFGLSARGQTWLNTWVGFFDGSNYGKSWQLFGTISQKNGDADGDNEVTILDYIALS